MKPDQKVVFLDRDGVLIEDVNYLSRIEDIHFYPDVPKGLYRLKEAGYKLVIITNQSGVARGYFPESFVSDCHERMNQILKADQVQLDNLYYCPHHLDGNPPLNIKCNCRKPSPGMILQAKEDLGLNLDCAVMLGDKQSDMELAINAQISGILLRTGQGLVAVESVRKKFPAIPVCSTFSDAVDTILKSAC